MKRMDIFIMVMILCYIINLILIPLGVDIYSRCIICGIIGLCGGIYGQTN